ncbi:bifunctional diaminohydroxyphosphoribosylaminopyrimidine deaminase/5-amino-6-(5-phosphoribosylamino)uracil reductase RibD [Phycisphaerales bacterium AB-hyl4]|uniref:Riboflavin biosynthesis protein RibD n=1 Tax=Natronomicrosphaera hydrolytica TaxID=3242702 RepID=A0ABV4U7J0_9BACT
MKWDDQQFMAAALGLAARGRGAVEPNPMVGAVIVRDGQVIGEGWHARFGGAHAEVEAITNARGRGQDVAGATMYVTLEPCSHTGKTPPCAEAVIEAKLARVVIAMIDPFERVAGSGVRRLREAGVTVEVGLCEREAHELNAAFVKRVTMGLPWVVLKWAQTVDGRIATATGDSQWISCEASRRRVHEWRARVDAVMVGAGTAVADDPQLTARDVAVHRLARPVVVDPNLRTPTTGRLATASAKRLTLAVDEAVLAAGGEAVQQWQAKGTSLVGLPRLDGNEGMLDLRPLLRGLVEQHDATNVLVEGGAGLAGALLSQGLVDQVLAFVAPKVAGDASALGAVRGWTLGRMADALPLRLHDVERIEEDVLLDYRVGEARG